MYEKYSFGRRMIPTKKKLITATCLLHGACDITIEKSYNRHTHNSRRYAQLLFVILCIDYSNLRVWETREVL